MKIHFNIGYGGNIKITAEIDKEVYIIENEQVKEMLLKGALERGYEITKTNRQKYPRLTINQ